MFACFPMAMCLSFGRVEISTSKTGSLRILLRSIEWKNRSACGMSSSCCWLLSLTTTTSGFTFNRARYIVHWVVVDDTKEENSFVEAIDCQLKNLKCKEWASEWAIVEWWCDIDDHEIWLRYSNSKFFPLIIIRKKITFWFWTFLSDSWYFHTSLSIEG